MEIKDFLTIENERNKRNAAMYSRMLHIACGDGYDVLIGHHLTFEKHGDVASINEVPSADTLIFDHDMMLAVFGEMNYKLVMADLAVVPAMQRDERLSYWLDELGASA